MLLEIALVVKESDGHQRHPQSAGALDMVARQNPQTARVDRNRLVDAEFQREVSDRLGTQHAGVGFPPQGCFCQVLFQSPVRVVNTAVKHQFGRPHLQPLGRKLRKQRDRAVIQLPPADGIQLAEEVDYLRMPAPPQIPCQRHALLVQRLGHNSCGTSRLDYSAGNRLGLTHVTWAPDHVLCRQTANYTEGHQPRRPQCPSIDLKRLAGFSKLGISRKILPGRPAVAVARSLLLVYSLPTRL